MFWAKRVAVTLALASAWQSVPSKPTFALSRPPQRREAPPSVARWAPLASTASADEVKEEVSAEEEPPKEEPQKEEEDPRVALKEQIAELETSAFVLQF